MRIRLDPGAREPLSKQLRDELAARIAAGRPAPGERLPPIRDLAGRLRIAPNTVAKAYRELEDAGLLVGRGRLGTFVPDRLPLGPERTETLLEEAALAFVRRAAQIGRSGDDAVAAVRRAVRGRTRRR